MVQRLPGTKFPNAMLSAPTAIKLELTRENKKMDREEKIRNLLFSMTKELKFHKVDSNHTIMEVDYEKYVKLILGVMDSTPETLE